MPTIKISKSQWEMIGKKTGWMKKAQEDDKFKQEIEKKVRQFLNKTYLKSSMPPTKEQFENEVLDIVDESVTLGGFEKWLEKFNEQQKFIN